MLLSVLRSPILPVQPEISMLTKESVRFCQEISPEGSNREPVVKLPDRIGIVHPFALAVD